MKIFKKVKILLSLILMFGLVFAQNLSVKAAPSTVNRTIAGHYTGSGNPAYYFPLQIDSVTNKVVFCTQIHNGDYPEEVCTKSNSWDIKTSAGVAAIISAVGSNTSITTMTSQYYAATLAINKFLYNHNGGDSNNYVNDSGKLCLNTSNCDAEDAIYRSYLAAAEAAYNASYPDASVSISPNKLIFTLSGDNYVSNEFTISGNGYGSPSATLNGTSINNRISSTGPSSYKLTIPKSSLSLGNNTVEVAVNAQKGYNQAVNYTCSGHQTVTYGELETKKTTASASITGTITTEKIIQIKKVDEKGNLLSGAKLKLIDSSGAVKAEWETKDENPKEFTDLVVGEEYTVEETVTPTGYKKISSQKFTVSSDITAVQFVEVKNEKQAKVQIKKVDEKGNLLSGATLQLIDSSGVVKAEWKTKDENPKEFTTLVIGEEYTVKETVAPTGYTKISSQKFTVSSDTTKVQFVEIKNEKEVAKKVIIYKRDENNNLLGGAVLQLYDLDNNKEVGSRWRTENANQNPKTFENLRIGGHYEIREISAPEGYVLSTTPLKFTVTKQEGTDIEIKLNVKNTPNEIRILKIDADTKTPLVGVKLQVQNQAGDVVKDLNNNKLEWITTKNPYVIKKLSPGTYYIAEIETINGYTLNTERKQFVVKDEIKDTDEILQVEFENRSNGIKIVKVDAYTKKPLAGIKLQIQNKNGDVIKDSNNKKLEWITTENPYIIEKLPAGTYYVAEIATIDGYVLNTERKKFTVKDTDTVIPVTFENKPTEVKIIKIDEKTKKPLVGAHLQIENAAGEVIEKWVSDGNPYILRGLKNGKYYLVETEAPKGYELLTNKIEFEINNEKYEPIELVILNTAPNTLGARSTLLLCVAMFDIALGIGIVTYVKKSKVQ